MAARDLDRRDPEALGNGPPRPRRWQRAVLGAHDIRRGDVGHRLERGRLAAHPARLGTQVRDRPRREVVVAIVEEDTLRFGIGHGDASEVVDHERGL